MKVRDRRDGCVHYSALRHMKQSPAHYRHYCETPFEPTPAMLLGTLVHVELFGHQPGRTIAVWEGKRRNETGYQAWKSERLAAARNDGLEVTIVTLPEFERAQTIAEAVRAQDAMRPDGPLLFAEGCIYEVPLKWQDCGLELATGGVDVLNRAKRYAVDFKTTTCTAPWRWSRFAWDMGYHVQAAMYERALTSNGVDVTDLYCVGVEVDPPYAMTALKYSKPMLSVSINADLLELGRREMTELLERIKHCEETNEWPAYTLAPIEWVPPDHVVNRTQQQVSFDDEQETGT